MKKIFTVFALFLCLQLSAQDDGFRVTAESYSDTSVEMADTMHDNGKIYVVVAVVLLILVGFVGYTIALDRKLSKLEKEVFKEKA